MVDGFVRVIAAGFSLPNDKSILPFNQYLVDSSKPQLEGFRTALRMGFSLVCLHFKHTQNLEKDQNVECLTQENLDVIFGGYRRAERHSHCDRTEQFSRRQPPCSAEINPCSLDLWSPRRDFLRRLAPVY